MGIDDLAIDGCPLAFQQFIIRTQMTLEDSMTNFARATKQKSILICDRGIMDGSGYVDKATWMKVLESVNLDIFQAREGRYDAIFHLVTCADGAEKYYTLDNNSGRREDIETAKAQDKKTQLAWSGHPHHIIIDNQNGKSFEDKMNELQSKMASFVGLPTFTRKAHKFILLQPPIIGLIPELSSFDVRKVVLKQRFRSNSMDNLVDSSEADNATSPNASELYSVIRKRSQGNLHAYGITTYMLDDHHKKIEVKRRITKGVYELLSRSADPNRHQIRQRRYCFVWDKQSFNLDEYLYPFPGLFILRVTSNGNTQPKIPPFLSVGQEVTDSHQLSSYQLSLKGTTNPLRSFSQ